MLELPTAKFAFDVVKRDPNTGEQVELSVYQDSKTDRYFAIDASFLIDEDVQLVWVPFGHRVELIEEYE